MTNDNNLLEEFQNERPKLEEFRSGYRWITYGALLMYLFATVLFWVEFNQKGMMPEEETMENDFISMTLELSVVILIPSIVLALIVTFFVKKPFSFLERFKKIFVYLVLMLSSVLSAIFLLTLLKLKGIFDLLEIVDGIIN